MFIYMQFIMVYMYKELFGTINITNNKKAKANVFSFILSNAENPATIETIKGDRDVDYIYIFLF